VTSLRQFIPLALLLTFLLLVLRACSNYSGKGNEFVLRAQIVSVGERSITVDNITLNSARGKAKSWFDKGTHQIQNNYVQRLHRHTIGHVYSSDKREISLDDLHAGQWVVMYGSVRSSAKGKYSYYRPVYDRTILEAH
jgi:hypothetical protein